MEKTYTNSSGLPIDDILSAIRRRVSKEADARYSAERKVAKAEMLILRPEARVDLLLGEPDQIVEQSVEKLVELPRPVGKVALDVVSDTALRDLVREIVLEELAKAQLNRSA